MTDGLGFKWLKYFNRYIVLYIAGAYRLLILDGYGSYAMLEFDQYCIENKIISLYMPVYMSYLLQPLNVGYFSLFKIVYGYEVRELAR